ncbi:hypothetical protein M3G54_01650 [Brevibacterium casei]|uniref:hypothetical protein n=1 Tax=Brevibacterium casei TaxID=33889 RepID=UPI00223B7889|nr:hypothetical protein [Brevibacterium casei]MCT2357068.1 hypothetical protein [Brevibacterium casei]
MSKVDKSKWDPRKCSAESKKRPGEQCGAYPVRGLTVCRAHGGGSKRARAAAARNAEQEKLQAKARRLGVPIPVDAKDLPQVILDQIAAAAGMVQWCQARIDEFESDQDVWFGITKTSEEESSFGAKTLEVREARQHVLVQILRESRRDVVQFTKLALEAKIDEQQVRISENIGNQFERLIEVILGGLDLTADQTERVPELMQRALRTVGGGGK